MITPSQSQVLSLKGEGYSPSEIALMRGSSKSTVENLLLDAKERLGCRTRSQAVVLWWLLSHTTWQYILEFGYSSSVFGKGDQRVMIDQKTGETVVEWQLKRGSADSSAT